MTERKELTEWLQLNKLTLGKYDSDELAHMAVVCGFPMPLVCEVLSHWMTDRDTRTSYKIRQDWYVDRELRAAERGMGLTEQWAKLADYLIDGKEFA